MHSSYHKLQLNILSLHIYQLFFMIEVFSVTMFDQNGTEE